MKLELETNLTNLDKIIAHAEALAKGADEQTTLKKLTELRMTPAALVQRLHEVREQILKKEFAVLEAALDLDHTVADTLGVPGSETWAALPSSDPIASLLQLCSALNLSVGSLFTTKRGAVVRANERPQIKFYGVGLKDYLLTAREAEYFDGLPGFIR